MPAASQSTSEADQHVAVLAFPFGTHAFPLLTLAQSISASTSSPQEVTFSFFSTAKSNHTLFSALSPLPPNIKPYNVSDGLPEGFCPKDHLEPLQMFSKALPENFKSAIETAVAETGKKITCILTDAFYWFGLEMAEEMDAKWVPFWTAAPHSLLLHVSTDIIRQRMAIDGGHKDRTIDFIPGFSAIRAADLPEELLSGYLDSPVATMLHKMGQALPRATAVAVNSFEHLDPTIENELKSKLKMFLNIGPSPLTSPPPVTSDEYGCLNWLDQHKPASVVYIGFGSVITPPPHELAALADALEETKFPFIWSFRGDPEAKLPKGFLERTRTQGKIVPWAPQLQILKHPSTGAFVTHGGWNSVLESITGGVPMICRPFFGDQGMNRRMLEAGWGIGVGVEDGGFTKIGTIKALESTLSSEKGKLMREKIVALGEPAYKAVEPNGSSTKNLRTLVELVTK